ncbi:hypothetical protein BGZ49_003981, partial [Haplosporangium sp. Z 27]
MSNSIPIKKSRPEVIIIGAGIGGLMLALLLEQINVPYHVFERANEVKLLGSGMAFSGKVLVAFEQLSLLDDLLEVSKPYQKVNFFNAGLEKIAEYNLTEIHAATGYYWTFCTRPDLYDIIRKRVPAHKIIYGKKVLRTEEKDEKVHVHCSDNSVYASDIVVGADGAYSGVRQSMYSRMEKAGVLPESDKDGFSIGYTTIVGVANPPSGMEMDEEYTCFNQVLYGDNANCYVVKLPNNKISWGFGVQLPSQTAKDMQFRNSEWGPESSNSILDKYRDFPNPIGGTMGELFDATPKERTSKVFLEEKLFKTWHYGRCVLIGDACHKLHPAGGQGATSAIQEAIVLANCIYAMPDHSMNSIDEAFKKYVKYTYFNAEAVYNTSSAMAKILNGQKWYERAIRKVVLDYLQPLFLKSQIKKDQAFRPLVAWLPQIEKRGYGPVHPQVYEENTKPTKDQNKK